MIVSIEIGGIHHSDIADERCNTEKRHGNNLLGPGPAGADNGAGDIVPRCTCAIDTEAGDEGPYDARQDPSSGKYLPGKLSDSDSDLNLTRTSADVSRLTHRPGSAWIEEPEPAGKRTTTASRPRSCATATPATPTVPGMTSVIDLCRPSRLC